MQDSHTPCNPTYMHDADPGRNRCIPLFWLLAVTAAATFLRTRYLGSQIISGDELHLLVVITTRSFTEIPGTVTGFDYSVPLALFFRALSEAIPLDETMLRMPMLVCGCLTPALGALVARRFVSLPIAIALACMLAAHPLFIFYSRFIRPYAVCVVLLLVVLWCADRWSVKRRLRWLVTTALLSALASWFQPIALITTGLLFAAMLVRELILLKTEARISSPERGRPAAVILAGLSVVALTLLLFAPSLRELTGRMVLEKVGAGRLTAETVRINAAVLTGLPGIFPTLCFFLFTVSGSLLLAMRLKSRSLLLLVPLFGQPLVILLLQPSLIDLPLVLARYQLYVLPLALLGVCVLLSEVARRLGMAFSRAVPFLTTWSHAGPLAAALLTASWILLGPYPSIYRANNAYAHHYLFQTFQHESDPYWQAAQTHAAKVPLHPFYAEIYRSRQTTPLVIEWPPPMDYTKMTFHVAQAYHRCPLKIVAQPGEPWWSGERMALQNVMDFTCAEQLPDLQPGTTVLLHKNPVEEAVWFALGYAANAQPKPLHVQAYQQLFDRLSSLLGPPVFEDRFITVFKR